MATKNLNTRIQNKIDTSTNWAKATNFVPLAGEVIIYSDLNKIKIGDGSTAVNSLSFTDNIMTITASDVTITTDSTKGISPYSTSYGYTNITINTLDASSLKPNMTFLFICSGSFVVNSSYRNTRIRFGTSGDWLPLYYTTGIAAGNSYLTNGVIRPVIYRTDIVATGAMHVYTDSNSTYSPQQLGFGYGTCSTAEATTAQAATLSSYSLVTHGMVAIKFTYAVPASATLNINGKGAKAIYYNNAAITAGIIKAGDIAVFVYNGSQYELLAINHDIANKAPLASPALTGTPTAPTAAAGTNTTQIATTAFVKSAIDAAGSGTQIVDITGVYDSANEVVSLNFPTGTSDYFEYIDDLIEAGNLVRLKVTAEQSESWIAYFYHVKTSIPQDDSYHCFAQREILDDDTPHGGLIKITSNTVTYIEDAISGGTSGSTDVSDKIDYEDLNASGRTTTSEATLQWIIDSANSTKYQVPQGTYSKPSGGIPATDLASAVQTSLGKADSALQSVPSTYRTASAQDTIDNGKVAKAQGSSHAGEFLVVGSDGNVTTMSLSVWQSGGSY